MCPPSFQLEVRQDAKEVQNDVRALEHGLDADLPISARLLREMHAVLMQGVRGRSRAPGELRRSQNWIGPAGTRRRDGTFVPAPPGLMLEQALRLKHPEIYAAQQEGAPAHVPPSLPRGLP
ncbi:hypothetical protein Dalu01_00629 [Deinococcus aluminii]|uniref:Fic/DOC N-terminal domain-containing protein n=1 Tax=Deinococcus aluminii TaxID=1656885 RepID=A0ABP9XA66_9DEIO